MEADLIEEMKKTIDSNVNSINSKIKITRPIIGTEDQVKLPKDIWDKVVSLCKKAIKDEAVVVGLMKQLDTLQHTLDRVNEKVSKYADFVKNHNLESQYLAFERKLNQPELVSRIDRKRTQLKAQNEKKKEEQERTRRA